MKKFRFLSIFTALLLIAAGCSDTDKNMILDIEPDILVPDTTLAQPEEKKEETKLTDNRKRIYLTIDDAPLKGCEYIDSIVSAEKIKTNIFMVGNGIDGSQRFKKYYEAMAENNYIEIYNHSYSHANNRYAKYYKTPETVLEDFEKNQNDFNISHKIARLPGRNLWHIGDKKKNYKQSGATSAELLAENGYKVFGWDVEWMYDAKDYSPKQTIDELIEEIEKLNNSSGTFAKNQVVLLTHVQMFSKKNEKNDLGELITKLKEKEYEFEYLSAYSENN